MLHVSTVSMRHPLEATIARVVGSCKGQFALGCSRWQGAETRSIAYKLGGVRDFGGHFPANAGAIAMYRYTV